MRELCKENRRKLTFIQRKIDENKIYDKIKRIIWYKIQKAKQIDNKNRKSTKKRKIVSWPNTQDRERAR